MPQAAVDLEQTQYLRVLVLGAPKCGKSTQIISSLGKTFGPGYVICCGDKQGMRLAGSFWSDFKFDTIRDEVQMEGALKEARRGVKEGEYKWIFVDDFSLYATWLEGALRDASAEASLKKEPDGRRYWPEFKQRIMNIPRRMFDYKTHIVFASHWISPSPEIEGQRAKAGQGIMPMIGGTAREELPAAFQDVIFMEKITEKVNGKAVDRRVFQINPEGVWGPGCYNAKGTHTIDADFGAFWRLVTSTAAGEAAAKAGAGAPANGNGTTPSDPKEVANGKP